MSVPRFSRLVAFGAFALFTEATGLAYDFPFPDNRLGSADASGYLGVLVDEGWKLKVSEKESIPIRFQFSSKQERIVDGCLGEGWWVPLLESTVVEELEGLVRMTTLGGRHFFLVKDPKSPDKYDSHNLKWRGVLKPGERFDVQGPDGWSFQYDKGRISKATSPSGAELVWRRQGERVVSIDNGRGETLLGLEYNALGKLARLTARSGPAFTFEYGQFPKFASVAGQRVVTALRPSLSRIHEVSGKFEAQYLHGVDQGGDFHFEVKNGADSRATKFFYDDDGHVTADDASRYSVSFPGDQKSSPKITRTAVQTGITESYHFDPRTLTVTKLMQNGDTIEERFNGTPGPAFMKLRQRNASRDSIEKFVTTINYDGNGQPIRELFKTADGVSEKVIEAGSILVKDSLGTRRITMSPDGAQTITFPSSGSAGKLREVQLKNGRIVVPGQSKTESQPTNK